MLIQELKGAKMNWKNRLTNYNFWISIFSAVLLILQALKIEFDIAYVNEIFTAVLGLLVVIGIISDPTRITVKSNEIKQNVTSKTEENISEFKTEEVKEIEKEDDLIQTTLPIEKENESHDVNNENDIQTILKTISTSLDEKMKELAKFNLETLNRLNQPKEVDCNIGDQIKETEFHQQTTLPAAAETSNPFVDVIN